MPGNNQIMLSAKILVVSFIKIVASMTIVGAASLQPQDPCEEARAGIHIASVFAQQIHFTKALNNINFAFKQDQKEHGISFGKDSSGKTLVSAILTGGSISGSVPAIANAFADLHNHPNNSPPDAGDFYGLISINKNNPLYTTRYVVAANGIVYALLITNITDALKFTRQFPNQAPAFLGGPPGFPEAIVDETRVLKYQYHCSEEMATAFILEKYNTGVSLLKQQRNGHFIKIITYETNHESGPVFSPGSCH